MMSGIYRHYKGGFYQVLGVAAHSETDERLVVYVSLNTTLPGPRLCVRPLSMWNQLVDKGGGERVSRFTYIGTELPPEMHK